MLFAKDHNGKRIEPNYGETAICPICESKVVAICGEINIWHWRHETLQKCDSWREGETEWHRKWKNEFPKDWQEVIVKDNFSEHRADIKTINNLVLELQNSPISTIDIQIREKFYGKMVWLINAGKFNHNINKYSLVKKALRAHEDYDPTHSEYTIYTGYEVKELQDLIEKNLQLINQIKRLHYQNSEIPTLKDKLKKIKNSEDIYELEYSHILKNIDFDFRISVKEIEIEIKSLLKEKEKLNTILNDISSFPYCEHSNYENYQVCSFDKISNSNYQHCLFIEKNNFLFPEIQVYRNDYIFQKLAGNKEFEFIVDFKFATTKLYDDLEEINDKILYKLKTADCIIKEKSLIINNYLNQLLINYKLEKENLAEEQIEIELSIKNLKKQIEENELEDINYFYSNKRTKIKEHENEKYELMKKYKGQYTFSWKNRRKSWDFSNKLKFLDFGDFIYQIIGNTTLKKMTKFDFIEFIKNYD